MLRRVQTPSSTQQHTHRHTHTHTQTRTHTHTHTHTQQSQLAHQSLMDRSPINQAQCSFCSLSPCNYSQDIKNTCSLASLQVGISLTMDITRWFYAYCYAPGRDNLITSGRFYPEISRYYISS